MANFVALEEVDDEEKLYSFKARVRLLGTPRMSKNKTKYVMGVFQDKSACVPFSVFSVKKGETLEKAYKEGKVITIKNAKCKINEFNEELSLTLTNDSIVVILNDEEMQIDKPIPTIIDSLSDDLLATLNQEYVEVNGECISYETFDMKLDKSSEKKKEETVLVSAYVFSVKGELIQVRHWGKQQLMKVGEKYNLYYVEYNGDREILNIKPYSRVTRIE